MYGRCATKIGGLGDGLPALAKEAGSPRHTNQQHQLHSVITNDCHRPSLIGAISFNRNAQLMKTPPPPSYGIYAVRIDKSRPRGAYMGGYACLGGGVTRNPGVLTADPSHLPEGGYVCTGS